MAWKENSKSAPFAKCAKSAAPSANLFAPTRVLHPPFCGNTPASASITSQSVRNWTSHSFLSAWPENKNRLAPSLGAVRPMRFLQVYKREQLIVVSAFTIFPYGRIARYLPGSRAGPGDIPLPAVLLSQTLENRFHPTRARKGEP